MTWKDLLFKAAPGAAHVFKHKKTEKAYFYLGVLQHKTDDSINVLYSCRITGTMYTRSEEDFSEKFKRVI